MHLRRHPHYWRGRVSYWNGGEGRATIGSPGTNPVG
jgi:hypothetical protein